MIIFERTEETPTYGDTFYDGVKLEITGGYDTPINEYVKYFIVFLEALTFTHDQIMEFIKEYAEELNDDSMH